MFTLWLHWNAWSLLTRLLGHEQVSKLFDEANMIASNSTCYYRHWVEKIDEEASRVVVFLSQRIIAPSWNSSHAPNYHRCLRTRKIFFHNFPRSGIFFKCVGFCLLKLTKNTANDFLFILVSKSILTKKIVIQSCKYRKKITQERLRLKKTNHRTSASALENFLSLVFTAVSDFQWFHFSDFVIILLHFWSMNVSTILVGGQLHCESMNVYRSSPLPLQA